MRPEQIISALLVHMGNTLSGVLIGCLTGVAAASLLKNRPHAAVTVFAVVDLIQTVPTLAMLTFIMLLFGLNNSTVICAIFLYSLFPIMRSTFTGLTGVDSGIIRAGKGIGMTNTQLFFKVELPLALPVVLSGIRIAVISALGIATTGVFVGAGGLGSLIWLGIQRRNTVMMLSGAIPVSLLAVFFEYLLAATETNLTKRRTQ